MSNISDTQREDSSVQQYFAFLDRREKIADWVYGILIIGGFLLMIVGGIVLLS